MPMPSAVTCTITMTELLVQPCRDSDEPRLDGLYGLLSTYPNLDWVAPTLEIADSAARLRAALRMLYKQQRLRTVAWPVLLQTTVSSGEWNNSKPLFWTTCSELRWRIS
jgi:hypothetical protein